MRHTLVLLHGTCRLLGLVATPALPEEFHTAARTAGLADVDAVLAYADKEASSDTACVWSPDVGPDDFWRRFVACVLQQARAMCSGTDAELKVVNGYHVAALEMRNRALGPACLRLAGRMTHARPGVANNTWVHVLCAHMYAIAGVPMMANLADFLPDTPAAASTPSAFHRDMYAATKEDVRAAADAVDNPVAHLAHAKTFGGPVNLLLPQCAAVLETVLADVRRDCGEDAEALVRAAVEAAGDAMPGMDPASISDNPDEVAAVVDLVRAFEVLCDVVDVEGIAESMFAYMRS